MGTNPLFHDAANSVDFALCFFQMAVLGVLVPRAGGGRFLDSARLVVWHVCVSDSLPACARRTGAVRLERHALRIGGRGLSVRRL